MISNLDPKRDGLFQLAGAFGIVLLVLGLLMIPATASACSINAAGKCGGSACPDGETCKKVGDFECDCVSNLADWPTCEAGEKHCQVGDDEYICWPADESCPMPLGEAKEHSAAQVTFAVVEAPEDERGAVDVTLTVSGCNGCFLSPIQTLPGDFKGASVIEQYYRGGVNSSEIAWSGDTVWEKSCFGNPSGRCGSTRRTYRIGHK